MTPREVEIIVRNLEDAESNLGLDFLDHREYSYQHGYADALVEILMLTSGVAHDY
jgi:hypothetical protein